MSNTDEIKQRIDVVDLVSEYVQIKQSGTNWKGLCPFHNEKSPSFMVSRDKQIWHCFGCDEGGDIFTFVQKYEGIEFPEALQLLAEKAGVKLSKFDSKKLTQKNSLLDINRFSAEVYHKVLMDTEMGKKAREYARLRALSDDTLKSFKIGYAPDSWDFLINLLKKRGFKESDFPLAGLTIKKPNGGQYDRFRGRLTFPITNAHGQIVGFTARLLDDSKKDQGGKYINTPQTELYSKSYILFGLDKAKQKIKSQDLAVIVEGNMDVLVSHQAGVTNVIASSGTALTIEQLQTINRYTNNIALAFDMDIAGQVAAEKGINNALALGMNIKVIQLPKEIDGIHIKDPDDCVQVNVAYWEKAISDAVSIMEYYFTKIFSTYNKTDPQEKKKIAAELLRHILKLENKVEQDAWLTTLSRKLDVPENIFRESIATIESQKSDSLKPLEQSAKTRNLEIIKPRPHLLSEQFIALLLKEPKLLPHAIEAMDIEMIVDKSLQALYKKMLLYYNHSTNFDTVSFESQLEDSQSNLLETLQTLLLLADKDFVNFTKDDMEKELIIIVNSLQQYHISQKISEIQSNIQKAEEQKNKELIQELSKQFTHYTEKLNKLKTVI